MAYRTGSEKIKEAIEGFGLKALSKADLDYTKFVRAIADLTGTTTPRVEQVLNNYIGMRKIKEIHILTIPDEHVSEWIDQEVKKEKEAKAEDAKVKELIGVEDAKTQ